MRSKSNPNHIHSLKRSQTKPNTTLGFTSQCDLLVKPTPIPCFFLINYYWQSIIFYSPFFRAHEKTNLEQSNGMITFNSHYFENHHV